MSSDKEKSDAVVTTVLLDQSTYDVLPSATNLVGWGLEEDDKCKCGQYGSLDILYPVVHLACMKVDTRRDMTRY